MTSKRYTDEFKIGAVKQITERNYSVYEVAKRLGCTVMATKVPSTIKSPTSKKKSVI